MNNKNDDSKNDLNNNFRVEKQIDKDLISENCKQTDKKITCEKTNFKKDLHNVILLTFLYFLQVIPLGLTGSLPYLLSSRKVSYAEQATFSFAFWPFSIKLLWAPIVDSFWFPKIGKRKSWIVPIQYIIGFYLIYSSGYVKELIENTEQGENNNVKWLTFIFFIFTFLAATQDIAVDGWGLTILSKENAALSSTCESIGGTIGWFLGNVLFLVFESADVSNTYIRPYIGLENQDYGIITIDKFMTFFGIVYLITTTLLFLFKKETFNSENSSNNPSETSKLNLNSLIESYKPVWKIIQIKPIQTLIFVSFTLRLTIATDSMSMLKLVEAGVPKSKLGFMAFPLAPLEILLPVLISKMLKNQNPFKHFAKFLLFRLMINGLIAFWVYITPSLKNENDDFSIYYYAGCIFLKALNSIAIYSTYLPWVFFYSQISDKNYGGTYLTFLNTINNFSYSWIKTGTLYLADFFTYKKCNKNDKYLFNNLNEINQTLMYDDENLKNNFCSSSIESKACTDIGGQCDYLFDPYYFLTFLCILFGIFWILKIRKILNYLQNLPNSEWKVYENKIKLRKD